MHIYANQSGRSSVDFLNRLERAAPMKIVRLLTDNGSQFTDRFTSKKREPTGQHAFDAHSTERGIEHRLCPPRHPQTNGMVERFNGRISEVVSQPRFASAAELETMLERYVKTYNQQIPQRALNHLSPVQAIPLHTSFIHLISMCYAVQYGKSPSLGAVLYLIEVSRADEKSQKTAKDGNFLPS